MATTVMQEINAARRRHHDARGPASVENADAASRLWLSVLTHDLGVLALTMTPIEDVNTDPGIDPRDALLTLLADGHAFLQAIDERPGGF